MTGRKTYLALLLLLFVTCGCNSGGIPLLNYGADTWWGGSTPDYVTVRKGDTLYSIARRYDVPIRELIETNNLRPPYSLRIGQMLRMPDAKYHVVAKGDTLYNISKSYNVDMRQLSRTNNLREPFTLSIGQRLLLPGSIVTKTTASPQNAKTPAGKKVSSYQKSVRQKTTRKSVSYGTPVQKRSSKFAWPVRGTVISKFGVIAKGRNNDGINIKAPLGTAVKAADAGTIAYAGNELKGFGNLILIKHSGGWITAYAHNDRLLVRKGQKVRKGEKIATVGSTGGVSSPQLHFEIRAGKKAVNPLGYLQ